MSEVSSAVMSTSPSPCPAWPSPTSKSAPGACTGMQRTLNARREFRHHPLLIQRNDFHFRVRIIVGQIAATRSEPVVRVRNGKFYGENFYFEHVAGFRAFDVNRPSENVPAGPFVLHLVGDVAQRLLDLIRRQARILKPLRTIRDQRLNLHRIARLDAQHRRCLCVVVTPRHSLWRRLQRMRRLGSCLLSEENGRGKENSKAQKDCAESHSAPMHSKFKR